MNKMYPFMNGGYFADILAQPIALSRTLEKLSIAPPLHRIINKIRSGDYHQIILTGMGSSLYVFHPLQIFLLDNGIASVMLETSELMYYHHPLITSNTLIITASQSGKSAETLILLEQFAGKVDILGITNTVDSPLALYANAVILTHAGNENTVSCKTYVAALLALSWFQGVLKDDVGNNIFDELVTIPQAVQEYLNQWENHVNEFQSELSGIAQIYYTGRGPSLASTGTAGLTTKESAHFPAEGMSCAAFRHGPLEIVGPETAVVVFAGAPKTRLLNQHLAEDIRRLGGKVFWIGYDSTSSACRLPQSPLSFQQIFEILPVQMITLSLPNPHDHIIGNFRYSSKVTAIE